MGRLVVMWLVGMALQAVPSPASTLNRFEFTQTEMAVPIRIVLYADDDATAAAAAKAAFTRFHELNAIFSDYDPQSELRRLCDASSEGKPVPVSEDLWRVLVRALDLSARSDGAFDVTVGPVVRLWRSAGAPKNFPRLKQFKWPCRAWVIVGFVFIPTGGRWNCCGRRCGWILAGSPRDMRSMRP